MRWWLLLVVVLVACKDNVWERGVRDSDRAAWKAQPVIELERHPFFSTVPLEKKPLSDGSEIWDYTNCGTDPVRTNCATNPNGYGGVATNCRSTGGGTSCCHHQFVVRASMVEEYRPVGDDCYTGCERRPGARCN